MKRRIGCLHAHYSNIEYIEHALSPYNVELTHFVDPALIYRVASDKNFSEAEAQLKVKEQIEWIAQTHVDAILITCTNYIAMLQEEQLSISVPIIKIDEPYFEYICNIQQPLVMLFTNPLTVNGTVERFNQYARKHNKCLDIEVMVINNTFDLIMKGLKQEYNQAISNFLNTIIDEDKIISVAQLSMVEASKAVEGSTSKTIINPLDPLIAYLVNKIEIDYSSLHE